jgi:ferritin-like metal-binding protein YciE
MQQLNNVSLHQLLISNFFFKINISMKKAMNLSELLAENLKKIYASEQQQHAALMDIRQRSNSETLRNTFIAYEKTKQENLNRLKQSFDTLHINTRGHKCEVVHALINDCQENVNNAAEPHVGDAVLIGTFQQINHFNIANYGTVASFAKTLNQNKVAQLLHDALEDEKATDEKLSQIAEEIINPSAVLTI